MAGTTGPVHEAHRARSAKGGFAPLYRQPVHLFRRKQEAIDHERIQGLETTRAIFRLS
jgi:hypothetical protein